MPHNEILPECQEKFKGLDKHIEDSPTVRDMVVRHDIQIKTMIENIAALANLKRTIVGSSMSVIVSVMVARFEPFPMKTEPLVRALKRTDAKERTAEPLVMSA